MNIFVIFQDIVDINLLNFTIQGFPKLDLSHIKLIEPVWMTLGIVNINLDLCMTYKPPIIRNKLPCDNCIGHRQHFTVNGK